MCLVITQIIFFFSESEDSSTQKRPKTVNGNIFDALGTTVKKPAPAPKYVESSNFMDALDTTRPALPPASVPISSNAQSSVSATSPSSSTPGLIRRKKRPTPGPVSIPNRSSPLPEAEPSPPAVSTQSTQGPIYKNGKKCVWWPEDSKITRVKYFEVDHDIHNRQHGDAMKKAEMQLDRDALRKAKNEQSRQAQFEKESQSSTHISLAAYRDRASHSSPSYSPGQSSPGGTWKPLIPLDVPDNISAIQDAFGRDSQEKYQQTDHQLRNLEVVYFFKKEYD